MNGNRWGVVRSTLVLVALGSAACSSDSKGPTPAGPPATLTVVSGSGQEGESGEPLATALTVKAVDLQGRPVPKAVVTFAVASGGGTLTQALDTTDTEGLASTSWIMGGQLGAASVTARVTGLITPAIFNATVKAGPPAVVARISGLVGSSASGFDVADSVAIKLSDKFGHAIVGANVTFTVTGGGGTVSHATKTTGADGVARTSWKLGAAGAQTLRASSGALNVDVTGTAVACNETSIAVGQVIEVTPGAAACLVTTATGAQKYIVAVANGTTSPNAASSFNLRGAGGTSSGSETSTQAHWTQEFRRTGWSDQERFGRSAEAHARLMRANADLLNRFGPSRRASPPNLQPAPLPNVGDVVTVKIPGVDNICTSATAIRARVIYVGTRGVVLEDSANILAGQMDADYRALGQEFDNAMFPVLQENFGNPLAFDAVTDANDRVFMIFTREVNGMAQGGIAGFVSAADFLPGQCTASNNGEYFYARAPTSLSEGTATGTLGEWQWSTPTVIVHEVKHVTSYAEKLARGWNFPQNWQSRDQWLEEGSAMMAEELWVRTVYGYGRGQNVSYERSIACELDILRAAHRPECPTASPKSMLDHFFFLYDYQDSPETHSAIGPVDNDDFTFYGSGWMFLRWLIDAYAPSEPAFLRSMNFEMELPGTDNIEQRTNRTFGDLLVDFGMALALDDLPGFVPNDLKYSIPSWNTRSVFAGLNSERNVVLNQIYFIKPIPLVPRAAAFGRFAINIPAVRGGGFAIFEVAGSTTNKQLLEFKGPSGAGFPAEMRIRIARVQ